MVLGFIGWTALGLITSLIASTLVNKGKDGWYLDILLGVVGAVVCGWLFNVAGSGGVAHFNAWSLVFAAVGSVSLVLLHSFRHPTCVAPTARASTERTRT